MRYAARFLALLFLSLCLSPAMTRADEPLTTVPAVYAEVVRERVFDAQIEAVNQATVSAQISGRVVEIRFDVDDYVVKGDVLIRFRDREQRARLQSAEARFEEAEAEFKRIEEVFKKKVVSRAAYDRAAAQLKAARAALAEAREALEHTVVRAPYNGIVVKRHIEVGETAQRGQPLMTGLSLEQLRATVQIPQNLINAVRAQRRARVILGQDSVVPAEKLVISPYADPKSHTFEVRARLAASVPGVYPGMLAKIAFAVGTARRLTVPQQALAHRSEVTAVYVQEETGLVLRQVRVGSSLPDGRIEILAGLTEGEQVALDPVVAAVHIKGGTVPDAVREE